MSDKNQVEQQIDSIIGLMRQACVSAYEAGRSNDQLALDENHVRQKIEKFVAQFDDGMTTPSAAGSEELSNDIDRLRTKFEIAAQNNATYEAVMEAIGEDEPEPFGDQYTDTAYVKGKNNLRAELRQSIAKIFGIEEEK